MNKKGFTYTLNIDAEIKDLVAKTAQVKKSMESIMAANKAPGAEKYFRSIENALDRLQQKASKPIESVNTFAGIQKEAESVGLSIKRLGEVIGDLDKLSTTDKLDLLPPDLKAKIVSANSALEKYTKTVEKSSQKSKDLEQAEKDLAKAKRDAIKAEEKLSDKKQFLEIQSKETKAIKENAQATLAKKEALEKFLKTQQAYESAGGDKRKAGGGGVKELEGMNLPADRRAAKAAMPELDLSNTAAVEQAIAELTQEYKDQSEAVKAAEAAQKRYENSMKNASTGVEVAKGKVDKLEQSVENLNSEFQNNKTQSIKNAYAELRQEAEKLGIDLTNIPIDYTEENFEQLSAVMTQLGVQSIDRVNQDLNQLKTNFNTAGTSADVFGDKISATALDVNKLDEQVKNTQAFTQRIAQFVGLEGGIQIARRAMQNAIGTIKELDAAMTEMAVVTELDVGDYWNQLPEYTKRANALGVSIKSAYESATLYYQQGLKTNEVVAMSNETLKMARIAGLSAEDATNKMTAALRGFNMELNETSAQRVADVYSELAAITASDVNEISSAMTKTASIASSAGMEFETTAAFLSQIIETTRESAETAGTALKTVIARFQELKKDPAEIGEVDGEVVDANKIETALRSVGVALRDTSGQFRDLDAVFLELAGKWNTLDTNTQRYIATIAAGSRQQSRFIAMMSDYNRTQELVTAANTSAGASNKQFEKTLESLDAKLNQLKNSWDTFTMGLMDSEILKTGVDILNQLMSAINGIVALFDKFGMGGVASVGMVITALKLGDKALNVFTKSIKEGSSILGSFGKVGKSALVGIKDQLSSIQKIWKNTDLKTTTKATKAFTEQEKIINKLNNISAEYNQINGAGIENEKRRIELSQESILLKQQQSTSTIEYATAIGLSNSQAQTAATFTAMNIGLNEACEASVGGLTQEIYEKMTAQWAEKGLTEAEIQQKQRELVAAYALIGAEKLEKQTRKASLLVRLASIPALLFGNKQKRIEAMVTLGLIPAEKAEAAAKGEQVAAQWSLNAAMLACPIGWILLGLAALAAAIWVVVKAIKAVSPEAKLEAAKESLEAASKAATEAKDAFEGLSDSFDSLADKYDALDELTEGTKEWKEAVKEINSEVIELIGQYPKLASMVKQVNGVLTLDIESEEVQGVLQDYEKASLKANSVEMASKIAVDRAQNDVDYKNLDRETKLGNQVGLTFQKIGAGILMSSGLAGLGIGSAVWKDANEKRDQNKDNTNDMAKAIANGWIAQDENGVWQIIEGNEEAVAELGLNADLVAKFGEELGEGAEELRKYGLALKQREEQEKAYMDAIALNASQMVDTSGMTAQEISQMQNAASGDLAKKIQDAQMETLLAELGDFDKAKGREERKDEIEKMAAELYPDQKIKVKENKNEVVIGEGDEAKTLSYDLFVQQYATAKSTELAAEKLVKVPGIIEKGINKVARNDNDKSEAIAKAFADSTGGSLTIGNLESLQNPEQIARDMWKNMSKEEKAVYEGEFELFAQTFLDSVKIAQTAVNDVNEELAKFGVDTSQLTYNKNLTTDQLSQYAEELREIAIENGDAAAQTVNEALNSLTKNLSDEEFSQFMIELNALDWDNKEEWEKLPELLEELGLKLPNEELQEFIDKAIEATNAIKELNFEELQKQLTDLVNISNKIETGEQGRFFSQEAYESIIANNPDLFGQFLPTLEGEWYYMGQSMDRLNTTIQEAIGKIPSEIGSYFEALNGFKEAVETVQKNEKKDIQGMSQEDPEDKIKYVMAIKDALLQINPNYDFASLGVENFGKDTSEEDLKNLANKSIDDLNNIFTAFTTKFMESTNQLAVALQAYTTEALKNSALENSLNASSARNQVTQDKNWNTKTDEEKGEILSHQYALQIQAQTAGVNKIIIDEYIGLLEQMEEMWAKGIFDGDEYNKIDKEVAKLQQQITNAITLGAQEINFNETREEIEALLEEVEELGDGFNDFEKIQKVFAKFGLKVPQEQAASMLQMLKTIMSGTEEGYQYLYQLFEMVVIASGHSAEMAAKMWEGEWTESIANVNSELLNFLQFLNSLGFGSGIDYGDGNIGWSGISEQNYVNYIAPDKEEPEPWENPYNWLYNMNEKVNQLIRERDKLEREYNRTLTQNETSAAKILEITKQELAVLKEQAEVARNTIIAADASLQSLIGNNSQFAQYVGIDSDGRITIDYEGAEAAFGADSEQGQYFEEFVSRVEELTGTAQDAQETLYDIEDQVQEIKNRGKDEYLDFEQRVFDAIVYQYEEEIKELQNINDSINDSNSKLLSAIQEGINESRKARTKEKTQEKLTEQLNRLAYLRMDTSGANALEILQLEKELEQESESYSDSLIDEAIEKLQQSNDKAAEQREMQITLLEDSLEQNKNNGAIWEEVKEMWKSAFTTEGALDMDSQMGQALKLAENWKGMSEIAKQEWASEIQTSGAIAQAYLDIQSSDIPEMIKDIDKIVTTSEALTQHMISIQENFDTKLSEYPAAFGLDAHFKSVVDAISGLKLSVVVNIDTGDDDDKGDEPETKTETEKYATYDDLVRAAEEADAADAAVKAHEETLAKYKALGDKDKIARAEKALEAAKKYAEEANAEYFNVLNSYEQSPEYQQKQKETQEIEEKHAQEMVDNNDSRSNQTIEQELKQIDDAIWEIERSGGIRERLQKMYRELDPSDIEGQNKIEGWMQEVEQELDELKTKRAKLLRESGQTAGVKMGAGSSGGGVRGFKTGGLADFTGPAWLDGTKSRPELVLNQRDTANFIQLKDILSDILTNNVPSARQNESTGDNYFDIDIEVDSISNDYDVEQLADKIKGMIYEDSTYRNVNTINLIR